MVSEIISDSRATSPGIRKETIKNVRGRMLGVVRNDANGRAQAYGVQRDLLRSYDPVSDITRDVQGRMIAKGNVLSGVVWRNRR
jgi:hypothetical protein